MEQQTISVEELKAAFGTYIGTNQKDILRLLTQPTVSEQHMTTVVSADLVYRASKAVIEDLVQGFQESWTPKGTTTFTPISILQRRHKIDLTFNPDKVFNTWLGFMTDESTDRKTWPITKYMIENLIIPKVQSNRETKLIGTGKYEEPVEGTPQVVGKSMDGFCTILKELKASGDSRINFIDLEPLTLDNIFDQVEAFSMAVDELYQSVEMEVFLSRKWYAAYHRKRRDLHGLDQNYTPEKSLIEGTAMTLVPLPSMKGENIMFTTPKENFIRLLNRNNGASNLSIESIDRQIKVFADWHESVGFGIQEAIFAYVPGQGSL